MLLTLVFARAVGAQSVDFSTLPASATAAPVEPDGKPHPVRVRLLADRASAVPGATARVGVLLEQQEGWHTYWKSPGGIGQPTEVSWTLPDGVSASPLAFPVPERFVQDEIVSYGYDHQVLLMADLAVPADAQGPLRIAATVRWLVCKETCRPGEGSAALDLALAAGEGARQPWSDLFDATAARVPKPPPGDLVVQTSWATPFAAGQPFRWEARVQWADGRPMPAPGPEPWPLAAPMALSYDVEVTGLTVTTNGDGSLVAAVEGTAFEPDPPRAEDRMGVLVQLPDGDRVVVAELSSAIPWTPATSTAVAAASPARPPPPPAEGATGGLLLASNLLWALVGGLLLNIMPCVLPVLTLKLYGLVEQSGITVREQRTAGAAYTAGIVASFWALAAAVLGLRAALGVSVDWGFQFQYPGYVAALATVVFLFGLSLFGVFEIPALGTSAAGAAGDREGVVGYFFTGVFATLLATPCSAPFLGTAVAFAFTSPPLELFAIFSAIGLGLAAPFLFVAFVPAAYRLLPRPGAWMESFKQLLGFSLVATTVWLVDVLGAQLGPDGTTGFLGFLCFVGLGAWVFGRWGGVGASGIEQARAALASAVVMGVGGWWLLDLEPAEAAICDAEVQREVDWSAGHVPWQAFSDSAVARLGAEGAPVFVDFTADWCLTCKINERAILETDTVRNKLQACGVVPLKADWTRRNDEITAWLHRFGRAGVPMYLVLPGDPADAPILLPEVISPSMVTEAIDRVCVAGV